MNIAMWSGPRNLSTAMMYAFAQRADMSVRDEPFYAAYLAASGAAHPMRAAVLASQSQDPSVVATACAAPAKEGTLHLYLKLMTHHMVDGFDLGFMAACRNCFLIRHPARVLASYAAKREGATLADTGLPMQARLVAETEALGHAPIILDSADVRRDPEAALAVLCGALELPFDPAMLSWPAGGNPADGVWASHWYGAVHRSTGFAPAEGPLPDLPPTLAAIAEAALPTYRALAARKLSV